MAHFNSALGTNTWFEIPRHMSAWQYGCDWLEI